MKKKLMVILLILSFISCDTASVDLNNSNYVFDGRGGVKCDVNGVERKPSIVTSPGPGSSQLKYENYMGEDFITLRFHTRDENNTFLAVRMVIKGLNPYVSNLKGMTVALNDYSIGMYSINTQIDYSTNHEYVGEFEIIYHDQNKRILAGRFWYDAVNSVNEIKEIRNGQFDMRY